MLEKLNDNSDEISIKDLIVKLTDYWVYLKSKLLKIILIGFVGGCIGFTSTWLQPITYTAKMTFVVEEAKSGGSGLGGLASLAGQFGVDVGGGSGGGVFSGDNILLYFKSESLAREVLLSRYDSISNKSVAEVYLEVYKKKLDWEKKIDLRKVIFPIANETQRYSRLQDSLIHILIATIYNSHFSIIKTDKKSSFIEVKVNMENEELAKKYCEKVVQIAVDRYINIKTQRQKITVDKLQLRVDSIANLLSRKTASSAELQSSSTTMDINPLYRAGTSFAVETTTRDKTMLATIFASVVQNLELAKFTLSQETPVIQVVDSPTLPLIENKKSIIKNTFTFFMIFSFIGMGFFIIKKIFLKFNI